MRRFAQVMNDLELVDLPLQGGTFTWSGGFQNQAWARLDRFMVSPSWLDQFRNVTQKRLSRPISDHFPIIIEGGGIKRGPVPFRFENMWLKVEGFKDLLRSWWQGMSVSGRASYRLATKLKVIKQNLKVWNKEVFGNLESNKMAALQQVDYWDQVEGERGLTEEELSRRKEVKDDYAKWVRLEEIHWRQLSRELWLREGDRNTGYFHRMANAHRRRQSMDKIKINGVWLSEEQDVKNGIVDAFQRLLTEDSEWKADIGGLDLNQISQQEADTLELPFTEEEEEILEMFKEFHEQKAFLKSLNTTFLVLIPKKGGAEELGDFRPISLVGGLYKLLAKVLANRIKNVVGKVVSSDQNAFVMNRQILDASLIANEVIDSWKKRGEKGLICKLDIEKAYDSVNWKFLMRVMQKMGFGVKWREWIWSCISTAKFLVLINGEPAGFFSSSRGLRQGDPLSPYLFIMGMEDSEGRGQAVNISHLLFADDAIVFCEAKKDDMTFLSWILCWFEAASGLRINLAKSEIIPVGEVEEILEMAVELGCKVGKLPSTYLGLPLGAPNKVGSVWDGVEERMRWKLALWKRQYISKGGRIALIKSTLASMPLYQMSLFRMPRVVARRLEKLQRDFLWGGGSMERKAHLVNWERVCMGKEKGGLGLRKLIPLNKALLGKWVWRFANAKEEMWKRVLVAKYGQEEFGWWTKKANGVFGVGVWKEESKNHHGRGLGSLEGGKNGKFEVKEAYELLISHSTLLFPKKGIWVENVPSKLAFFAWEATWGRVLTLDRLQKRGWQLPNRCYLCGMDEENVNHLLIHCTVARVLWGIVLGLVGAQWVFPESVKEVIVS
ncbi:Transposon TX1 uncharacterized 149 kDa protein [Vitis vinifera]|uniref:Transposon TX1 uncharacterized 149 kDa protein n=1 Tax=Vitis vinifera TaxID=29760 RepID=A0A438E8T0_VITVI|nr:Transposon TX1 uncharacterized 149 kDa protein [Vitis vinifera]